MSLFDLNTIKNLNEFEELLNLSWSSKIKKWGGRTFVYEEKQYTLHNFIKQFELLASLKPIDDFNQISRIAERIKAIHQLPVNYSHILLKISTALRSFFGNFGSNHFKVLNHLAEGELITSNNKDFRFLVFSRKDNQIACRVHGISSKTFPRISKDYDVNYATRTILRNKNLVVLRGSEPGTRMIGPCDFYGPLEYAHKYVYTIKVENGFPKFYRKEKDKVNLTKDGSLSTDFTGMTTLIDVAWHKGNDPQTAELKKQYLNQNQKTTGESLFPTSAGILEVEQETVSLPSFDPRKMDLTPFKARLVKNETPFSIAETAVSSSDSFCPVTYMFEENYAKEVVENGGGLFLENHDFCQTMTPLDSDAGGFVVLGRWKDETNKRLELIGVQIPFGYTLIVDKNAIHGDTTLKGMYMMAMTSNHVTMQTADVTFLKNKMTRKNVDISIDSEGFKGFEARANHKPIKAAPPIANFANDNPLFTNEINNEWSIYNPFSRILNPKFLKL